jgi:ATPase subunit of ABC transporter with duplicated ATPase domains
VLQVSNASKSFGDNTLFERVSFTLNRGERVGLIGPNGCGKTTLFRIILGEIQPDTGSVRLSPGDVQAGYLAQALEYQPGQTVGHVMKDAIAGLAGAEQRLEDLSARMAPQRRPENTPGTGSPAHLQSRPAPDGRTHQPPGYRRAGVAGGVLACF